MRRTLLPVMLLVSACGGAAAGAESTPVRLTEGAIAVENPLLHQGRISLVIENVGQYDHTLVVTTDAGAVVAATGLIAAGEATTLQVDLAPGGYQFSCRIVAVGRDGGLVDHYQQGMKANVRVTTG